MRSVSREVPADRERTETGKALGGRSVLVLPRTHVLQRLFVLPTSDPREIERILRYRIPAETPFLLEQVAWSWRLVEELADRTVLVRLCLVEKRRMLRYLDLCRVSRGIHGLLIEDELVGLIGDSANVTARNGGERQARCYRVQDRLLVTLERAGLCVCSSVTSTADMADAAASVTDLAEGLFLEFPFLKKADTVLDARLEEPLRRFERAEGEQGRRPAQPALLPLPEGGWLLDTRRVGNRRLAASLRSASSRDLLPEAWKARARGARLLRRLVVVAAAGLALAAGLSAGLGHLETRLASRRQIVDAERLELRSSLEDVEAAQMLIQRVEVWSSSSRTILAAWDRIAAAVPAGLSLTSLMLRDQGAVTVHGAASDRNAILSFMEALRGEESGLFAQVMLAGLEDRGGEQLFQLNLRVRAGALTAAEVSP